MAWGLPWGPTGGESVCQCRVQPLVQKDPTSHGTTKPMPPTPEPVLRSPGAAAPEVPAPWSPCSATEVTAMRSPRTIATEQPLLPTAGEKLAHNRGLIFTSSTTSCNKSNCVLIYF